MVVMSRDNYYIPEVDTYLSDGSFCIDNFDCASECCAATPDVATQFLYEEDIEEADAILSETEMEEAESDCIQEI